MIIFRKKIGKDSSGLRGYWAHSRDAKQIWSFATGKDFNIGDNVEPRDYELPIVEVQFKTAKQFDNFIAIFNL